LVGGRSLGGFRENTAVCDFRGFIFRPDKKESVLMHAEFDELTRSQCQQRHSYRGINVHVFPSLGQAFAFQFLPGLTARIGEFKVPYTIENELSPTTVELINCYSQSVCYLAGVSGSDKCYGMTSGRDIGMMLHGKLFRDFLQYKVAVMNGQGLNTKDKNSQKDVVGNLMVNPLKWLSVGGSFIRGTGHAIADSEYTGIKAGENYAKRRWSAGGVVTTSTFNLRTEYLAGKDRSVKSEGFYATGSVRFARNFDFIASFDYFNPNKAADFKQNNYIAGVQYWFYPRCRLQAQYTFCNKKGDGQKDSNLIQAQVQVRF
jgi:hypothetical protein